MIQKLSFKNKYYYKKNKKIDEIYFKVDDLTV